MYFASLTDSLANVSFGHQPMSQAHKRQLNKSFCLHKRSKMSPTKKSLLIPGNRQWQQLMRIMIMKSDQGLASVCIVWTESFWEIFVCSDELSSCVIWQQTMGLIGVRCRFSKCPRGWTVEQIRWHLMILQYLRQCYFVKTVTLARCL